MEIITGIERRRRWSAEEKLRIVAETERADGGIAEIARRYEISRGLLWNWRSQVRLPGSVRFNCTPDLAISVKVRIRLLMLAFWDIGVRASEGPPAASAYWPVSAARNLRCGRSVALPGRCAGLLCSDLAIPCPPALPQRRTGHRGGSRLSGDTRQRRKAAGGAQGVREPAESWGRMGCFSTPIPG